MVGVLSTALFAAVSGCSPDDSSQTDEEKEPHFVLGNSRFNEMNYDGAIEAFEESLEVNPHSAQAHYRLAQIFDSQRPDPAAAIYHYQEYLKLSPNADNRDVITQRIQSCKQQLAADVLQLPSTPAMQRQLDTLVQTNRLLEAQVDQLNGVIKQWSAYCASLQAQMQAQAAQTAAPQGNSNPTPNPAPQTSVTPDDISAGSSSPQPQASSSTDTGAVVSPRPAPSHSIRTRIHVVASGETMASIARKHGISLSALEAANPRVNPKRLRVGEPLNLPL